MTEAEHSQQELERRVFHLKTLYDLSQMIGSLRDPEQIMKNLLLMVIGTFGALRGLVLLVDVQQGRVTAAAQRGLGHTALEELRQMLDADDFAEIKGVMDVQQLHAPEPIRTADAKFFACLTAAQMQLWIPFAVNENFKGGIGLGAKLLGDPCTLDDQELLGTLANQLTMAVDNALAYMEIRQLNVGLETKVQERTAELQQANEQLEIHNRFIRETFGRYVSQEVVANLLESPARLRLGGEKRQVTLLMSDLRGFTSLAERLAPEQVVRIINRYLSAMVDVILRHHGTINEFIGDAILVLFGAPVRRQDHAEQAVGCAVAMQLAMDSVNAQNRREGLPAVEMGIGVHTGEVVVGNIGSHKRTKYGVVGSHVNLTSRIESYTVGGQILISEATRHAVGPILRIAREIEIAAKGIDGLVVLHDIRGLGGAYNLSLPERQEALVPLPETIPVRYAVVEGTYLDGNVFTGHLVQLSRQGGVVLADHPVSPWSNLKIQLTGFSGETIPGDLYAKVMGSQARHFRGFTVRFTSIPPEVETFLQALLTSCSPE